MHQCGAPSHSVAGCTPDTIHIGSVPPVIRGHDAASVSTALHHAIDPDSDRFSLLLSVYGVILD